MASRQEGTLLQEFCRIGKKWKKINKHKVFYVIKKEEICSVINPKNYGKKNLLAFAEKIGNFTLNVTMVDEAGNPLTADDISQCHLSGFPILFTQNELLEALAKRNFQATVYLEIRTGERHQRVQQRRTDHQTDTVDATLSGLAETAVPLHRNPRRTLSEACHSLQELSGKTGGNGERPMGRLE